MLLYIEGIHQKGVPYENIIGRWNFLKYAMVDIEQKNKKKKTSKMLRAEIPQGIYSKLVCEETLDESPMAYKPSKEIIDSIKPTVDIINIIKPIYNLKATEKHKRWSKK